MSEAELLRKKAPNTLTKKERLWRKYDRILNPTKWPVITVSKEIDPNAVIEDDDFVAGILYFIKSRCISYMFSNNYIFSNYNFLDK